MKELSQLRFNHPKPDSITTASEDSGDNIDRSNLASVQPELWTKSSSLPAKLLERNSAFKRTFDAMNETNSSLKRKREEKTLNP